MKLELVKVAVAANAMESALRGETQSTFHSASMFAFFDELEKISVDRATFARIADKAAKRGWSAARESKSISRLAKFEGRATSTLGHEGHSLTRISRPQANGTVNARPPRQLAQPTGQAPAIAHAPQATHQAPQTPSTKPRTGLVKRLALGGAGLVGAGAVGHALPQHQQQQ